MLSAAAFRQSLESNCGWKSGEAVLAALSGGLDSVVLASLLRECSIPFALAHVNFGLRGEESDADEEFCAALAKKYSVSFWLHRCEKGELSKTGESSVQAAARKIRYDFFRRTAGQQGFAHIAVAHNSNDNTETVLLNLARGTGLQGLAGMDFRKENIIRPLLEFSRESILQYAQENSLRWREDSSNAGDDYTRNRFRHHLLPWLGSQMPQGEKGFAASIGRIRQASAFIEASLQHWENSCCISNENSIRISIPALLRFPSPFLFLGFYLHRYGFTETEIASLAEEIESPNGARFFTRERILFRQGDMLRLELRGQVPAENAQIELVPCSYDGIIPASRFEAVIDADLLDHPLKIRRWKAGDKLVPFGMNGHRLVSDILNEMKIPAHEKEFFELIECGSEIVWIPGYRIAHRFRVTERTQQVWRLSLRTQE